MTRIDAWKLTLPCTRAEAEAIDAADDLAIDAVLMTSETVADDRGAWRLDAYVEHEPDAAMIAAVGALVPSAAGVAPVIEALVARDWVTLSQAGLQPIREGRFVVHVAASPVEPPPGGRAYRIDAGRAFGTGHHGTTSGCLAMLDGLAERSFANIVDLGTGTGLLAFAARHLWPRATVTATDIDPIAVAVAQENALVNDVPSLRLLVADGTRDPAIAAEAPYDLVIANILAAPLIAMAPEIAAVAAPGATVVLAGLLATQADTVVAAYAACGCELRDVDHRGDWAILRLRAAAIRHRPLTPPDPTGRDGWALDV